MTKLRQDSKSLTIRWPTKTYRTICNLSNNYSVTKGQVVKAAFMFAINNPIAFGKEIDRFATLPKQPKPPDL